MAKSSSRTRRRARPLLIAVGAVVLCGCHTANHGSVAPQCPPGDGVASPCPVAPSDLSAEAPADLGAADLAPRSD